MFRRLPPTRLVRTRGVIRLWRTLLAAVAGILFCTGMATAAGDDWDPWRAWRPEAQPRGGQDFLAAHGPVLWCEDFSAEPNAQLWSNVKDGDLVAAEPNSARRVLRVLAGAEHLPSLRLPGAAVGVGAGDAVEWSIRLRLGRVPPKVPKGHGGLCRVSVAGGDGNYISFTLQGAYLAGGSWFFNGLAPRVGGKVTAWQEVRTRRGPASNRGMRLDTQWHELSLRTRGDELSIYWDRRLVFQARDDRIRPRDFSLSCTDPTDLFAHVDLGGVTVRGLRPGRAGQ